MPEIGLTSYTIEQAEEDIAKLNGMMAYLEEVGSALNLGLGGAGVSFPNTTVVAASLQPLASVTYPANHANTPGATYELEVWGNGQQGSTIQTLEFCTSFAGSNMQNVTFGTTAFGSSPSNSFRWVAKSRVICNTIGVLGTWTSYINATESVLGANISPADTNENFANGFSCEATTTLAADTTQPQTFALKAAWGSVTGAPTLTSQVAMFRRIA